jgi:hypothetical protein
MSEDANSLIQFREASSHRSVGMTIKLERVGDSLAVSVGPRVNWLGLFTAFLLVLILWGAGIVPAWEGLMRVLHAGQSPLGYILGIIALSGIALFVAYNIVLALFGSELTLINSSDLEIQSRTFGRIRSRRSFPNSTVEKLRYEEWWSGARGTPMEHGIRFECVGETITFARKATTAESHDIIDGMQQLYKFPIVDPPEEESSPAVTH